jgi:O-acetyl-ADP-ribose deacetylase (regulator of RNase III)
MIHYVKGNLLDSNCDYICHQVNCQGVMGSGIAKQIRERWPEVYEKYRKEYDFWTNKMGRAESPVGNIDIARINNSNQSVINMYTQRKYGYDGRRFTSYDAFAHALELIKTYILDDAKIGFPKNIGCGLGGGNWNVISALIEEILGEDYEVYIYEYEPEVK